MVNATRIRVTILVGAVLLPFACGRTVDESGGETNWLAPCEGDSDCRGGLTCACGLCTQGECLPPVDSGAVDSACLPLPCPPGAPWNPETCSCETCAPLPCPTGASWSPGTCSCETVADVTGPPAYCVAPCAWEMVKRCLPAGGACRRGSRQGTNGEITTFCQPETGWKAEAGWLETLPFGPIVLRVDNGTGECFYVGSGELPATADRGAVRITQWVPRAALMAEEGRGAMQIEDGPVLCGTLEELMNSGYSFNTPNDVPEGLEAYVLDRSQPECAAWDEWGFPVSPCAEVTPGSCQ
jgi:hypothetical protein